MTDEDFRAIIQEELQKTFGRATQQKLLTTAEVAKILGLKDQTLNLWRSKGNRGPAYLKISGGAVRYKLEEVENWMNKQSIVMD